MPNRAIQLLRYLVLVPLAMSLGSCDVLRTYRKVRTEQAAREKIRLADSVAMVLWSPPEDVKIMNPVCGRKGTVYVCGSDGMLYAIDRTGRLKWAYDLGDRAWSQPAVDADGTIHVGCNDKALYAITPDGELKWTYATEGRINCVPLIGPAGEVYFGSGDGKFYALGPDGTLKWSYAAPHGVWSSPVVDENGTVYFGCGDLYAVNPDGSLKWKFATEWQREKAYRISKDGETYLVGPDPALGADGSIYFCWNRRLYQVDASGKLQRKAVRGEFTAVYTGGSEGSCYVVDEFRGFPKLLCLNQDGTTKWSFQECTAIGSLAVDPDGIVYISSSDLRAIGSAGTEEWWLDTASRLRGKPVIGADGTIYACTDNELYAVPPGHRALSAEE